MNLCEDTCVHRGEGGMPQGELNVMKTLMTTSLTAMLLAGTTLMAAQTGNAPAPAANLFHHRPGEGEEASPQEEDQLYPGCRNQVGPGQLHAREVRFARGTPSGGWA